jgi:chemotaxis protein methyltransferase CheR
LGALREQAVAHLCAEQNGEARRIFEEILRREPNDVESLLGMALVLAGGGSGEATLQCCHQVLQLCPTSAEAYCVMALVHEGIGEDSQAQHELEKAVYLDQGFSMAHFRLACLHDRMGRSSARAREFSNTLDTLPNDDEQRVRHYSGGFDKDAVARICAQRLGQESSTIQEITS